MASFFDGISANLQNMPWVKIGLGIGTVFVGLICIVILCKLIGLFCRDKKNTGKTEEKTPASAPEGDERQKIIAAACAVCAEYMGKDVKALRVVSFKKL